LAKSVASKNSSTSWKWNVTTFVGLCL
jgi:hypothetical protein